MKSQSATNARTSSLIFTSQSDVTKSESTDQFILLQIQGFASPSIWVYVYGRRISYTLSIERVVSLKYAKCSLFIFQLCHAHVRKDTRLSPLFRTVQVMESSVGPGNEAGRGGGSRAKQSEKLIN